jgi:hypothetical protein
MDFPAMPKFRRPKAVATIISERIPRICQRTRVGRSALNRTFRKIQKSIGSSEVHGTKKFHSTTTRMLRGQNCCVNDDSHVKGFLSRQNGEIKRIACKTIHTQNIG